MSDDSKSGANLLDHGSGGLSIPHARSLPSTQRCELYERVKPGWEEVLSHPSEFFRERKDISRHLTGPGPLTGWRQVVASIFALGCLTVSIFFVYKELRVERIIVTRAGDWGEPTPVSVDLVPAALKTKQLAVNGFIEGKNWSEALKVARGMRDQLAQEDYSELRKKVAEEKHVEFQECLATCLVWIPHHEGRTTTVAPEARFKEAIDDFGKLSRWGFSTGISASFCHLDARGQQLDVERLKKPTPKQNFEPSEGGGSPPLVSLLIDIEKFRLQNAPAISGNDEIRRDIEFLEGFVLAKLLFQDEKKLLKFWTTRFDASNVENQKRWERLSELLESASDSTQKDQKFAVLETFFLEAALTFSGDPIQIGRWERKEKEIRGDLETRKNQLEDQK